jgi:hypothetical protein
MQNENKSLCHKVEPHHASLQFYGDKSGQQITDENVWNEMPGELWYIRLQCMQYTISKPHPVAVTHLRYCIFYSSLHVHVGDMRWQFSSSLQSTGFLFGINRNAGDWGETAIRKHANVIVPDSFCRFLPSTYSLTFDFTLAFQLLRYDWSGANNNFWWPFE